MKKSPAGISPGIALEMAVLKRKLALLPARLPGSLFIGLTSRCDLSCLHCKYAAGRPRPAAKEMAPGLLDRALAAAARLGIPRVIFFGGEPLLYPGLERAVKKAAGLGLFTELDTNGQALDLPRARRLAAAGLASVMVSLHAPEKRAHERVSGQGTFARALRAVQASAACGLVTYVSACVFSGGLGPAALKSLLAFSRRHGALGARLLPYSPPSGPSRLPGRLASRLSSASPDGYGRSCVSRGSPLCDAQKGRLLYLGPGGEARTCPYAEKPLGSFKELSLPALLAKRRRPAPGAGFPCHAG